MTTLARWAVVVLAAPARSLRRAVRWLRDSRAPAVGIFAAPIYATAPLHEDHLLFVVERAGRSASCATVSCPPQPFLDISALVSQNRRGRLAVGRVSAALLADRTVRRLLHRSRRLDPVRRVPALTVESGARGSTFGAADSDDPASRRQQPLRRLDGSSGLTACCTSEQATAAAAAISSGTPRTSARSSGSCSASARSRQLRTRSRQGTHSSACRAPGRRSSRTACATRCGSRSTVRPATSYRRRRPGPLGGDRRSTGARAGRARLRLECLRRAACVQPGAAPGAVFPGTRVPALAVRVLDYRRRRRARSRADVARWSVPVRRLLRRWTRSLSSASPRPRETRTRG